MAEPAHKPPEAHPTWPAQGQWTWDDYLRLPDDGQRYEIIEGVLYVAAAPTYDHQFAVYELAGEMRNFVKEASLGVVLGAPFDIRLPGVAEPVQPDLLFFRGGNEPKSGDKYFHGVPDLVGEVLSPGSKRLDQHVKFGAYEKAGVAEYWLVDPKARTITVFHLDGKQGLYDEAGHFGVGENVRSVVLAGFETPVASLFPPQF